MVGKPYRGPSDGHVKREVTESMSPMSAASPGAELAKALAGPSLRFLDPPMAILIQLRTSPLFLIDRAAAAPPCLRTCCRARSFVCRTSVVGWRRRFETR
jgi:hypothetical protein